MMRPDRIDLPRSWGLPAEWVIVLALAVVFTGCSSTSTATSTTAKSGLALTPAATEDVGEPTPSQTEGPYFKAGAPERTNLVDNGSTGQRLTITGRVVTISGQPIGGAKVDFWQADENGQYDNAGYRYRGYQLTGSDGSYRLETVVPGLYPGRTRHIHVKVVATGRPVLTTQLYFPDESANAGDNIFDSNLLLKNVSRSGDATQAGFDFVLG
jgi:protocatechuate 3,4-dioxygenase beta subunit